jgi:hypothetical protein
MLTPAEKILFALAVLASLYFTWRGVQRIIGNISSGQGRPDWSLIWKRLGQLVLKVGLFQPVFRFRLGPSILHALIGWGFLLFLLVNLNDLLYGYTGFAILTGTGRFGDVYRLLADIANTAILAGIVGMAIRRFILRPATLTARVNPAAPPAFQSCGLTIAAAFIRPGAAAAGRPFHLALDGRRAAVISMAAACGRGRWARCPRRTPILVSLGAEPSAVFPIQTHPSLLCADQFRAQAREKIHRTVKLPQPGRPVDRTVRCRENEGSGLGAGDGQLRLHHVLPLPGGLPGL